MKRLLVLLACPLLAACPEAAWVGVQDGSTADSLVLVVARSESSTYPIRPPVLVVGTCETYESGDILGEDVEWRIDRVGEGPRFRTIRYGVVPAGYVVSVDPTPLHNGGCYFAYVGTSYEVAFFEIDESGRVTRRDQPAKDRGSP